MGIMTGEEQVKHHRQQNPACQRYVSYLGIFKAYLYSTNGAVLFRPSLCQNAFPITVVTNKHATPRRNNVKSSIHIRQVLRGLASQSRLQSQDLDGCVNIALSGLGLGKRYLQLQSEKGYRCASSSCDCSTPSPPCCDTVSHCFKVA